MNELFEGEVTDGDQLSFVNHLKEKLLESDELLTQAENNSAAQFANSPTLSKETLDAIIDAGAAYSNHDQAGARFRAGPRGPEERAARPGPTV